MGSISKAILGSFVGRLIAVLFIALCVAVGFGPAEWAYTLIGWSEGSIALLVARLAFLLLGIAFLILSMVRLILEFWSPDLELDANNIRGAAVPLTQQPFSATPVAMWYVIKVVNKRPRVPAKSCRVLLKGISKKDAQGKFNDLSFAVPRQFWWAPSETTPQEVTIRTEQPFDLGYVANAQGDKFNVTLYSQPNAFQGNVSPGETLRYSISLEAENFVSRKPYIIEVAWDGTWSADPEQMKSHLVINPILP